MKQVFAFLLIVLLMESCVATLKSTEVDLDDPEVKSTLKSGVDICGNYCGPDWCAATVISETDCVATGLWGSPDAGTCADACCKMHDYCCGHADTRPQCNEAIVSCLSQSSCYFTLCGSVVWAAMKTVSNWCCGSQCPTSMISAVEAALSTETLHRLNTSLALALEYIRGKQ